jgi:hypothetical protein
MACAVQPVPFSADFDEDGPWLIRTLLPVRENTDLPFFSEKLQPAARRMALTCRPLSGIEHGHHTRDFR